MRLMKTWLALLLSLLLTVSFSTVVSADPEGELSPKDTLTKTYSLHISTVQGFIDASPRTPSFWEQPHLRAGEEYTEGTLIIRNSSENTTSLKLTSVSLPYGDAAKLNYLNHLVLTVKEGDTVLFDDVYTRINETDGGLSISLPEMAPGEEHFYTINLRCLYSYKGDPATDVSVLNWNFEASLLQPEVPQEESEPETPEWVTACIVVGLITLGAMVFTVLVFAIVWLVTFRKKKEKPEGENEKE